MQICFQKQFEKSVKNKYNTNLATLLMNEIWDAVEKNTEEELEANQMYIIQNIKK